jgi:uncharacterized membrane protein
VNYNVRGNIEGLTTSGFFWGRNFAKFQLEIYRFDIYKGFLMKQMTQIHHILKEKNSILLDFHDEFQ